MDNQIELRLSDKEAQAVFRALLDYRKILTWSAIADTAVVQDEISFVDGVSERLSLQTFTPESMA